MKHSYGGVWCVYYCCLCYKYFIEGSYACLTCKLKEGVIEEKPLECCHIGDAEVEVKVKKK
jgi:hypothetical protein